eukprot:3209114-Prymnesium_polylepis.2
MPPRKPVEGILESVLRMCILNPHSTTSPIMHVTSGSVGVIDVRESGCRRWTDAGRGMEAQRSHTRTVRVRNQCTSR